MGRSGASPDTEAELDEPISPSREEQKHPLRCRTMIVQSMFSHHELRREKAPRCAAVYLQEPTRPEISCPSLRAGSVSWSPFPPRVARCPPLLAGQWESTQLPHRRSQLLIWSRMDITYRHIILHARPGDMLPAVMRMPRNESKPLLAHGLWVCLCSIRLHACLELDLLFLLTPPPRAN